MKRLAPWLAFLFAAGAMAQDIGYADTKSNYAVSKDGGLVIPVGYLTIKDEVTALTQQGILSFLGAGVTCVNNGGNAATECTIPGGGAANYQTIQDEGGALTVRPIFNFIGAGVTCVDNAGATRTDCTIPAGGSNILLDGTNHTDTLNGAVVRGDLIAGNGTPKWARLAVGGASTLLTTNGTDPAWSTVNLLSAFHGDTLAGSPVRGSVIVANSTPKWAATTVGTTGTYVGTLDGVDTGFVDPVLDMNTAILADDDFCGAQRGLSTASGSGVIGNTSSGGTGTPCVRTLTTGAAVGMDTELYNTQSGTPRAIDVGTGAITIKSRFKLNSVGDGTDVIKWVFGLCDATTTNTECSNGVYLLYDRANSTTNWFICTANGGTRTRTDTTIAVNVAAQTTYVISINAAGNAVTCTIGGVSCAAHGGGNFPTQGSAIMLKNDKTAGATTVFTMDMDAVKAVQHGLSRN